MSNCLNTIEQRKRTVARHSCIMGVGVKWFGTRMGSGGYGQLRVRVFSWPPPTPTPDPPPLPACCCSCNGSSFASLRIAGGG